MGWRPSRVAFSFSAATSEPVPGAQGTVFDTIVSGRSAVRSAQLSRPLLFSDTKVDAGSVLDECVAFSGIMVGRDCRIPKAVIDAGCCIDGGVRVARLLAGLVSNVRYVDPIRPSLTVREGPLADCEAEPTVIDCSRNDRSQTDIRRSSAYPGANLLQSKQRTVKAANAHPYLAAVITILLISLGASTRNGGPQ